MSSITCKECGKNISDPVSFCPSCGKPIVKEEVSKDDGAPLSTKKTSTKFRLHTILSSLVFWIGLALFFSTVDTKNMNSEYIDSFPVLFILIFTVGAIWYIVTKFRIWWDNKICKTPK